MSLTGCCAKSSATRSSPQRRAANSQRPASNRRRPTQRRRRLPFQLGGPPEAAVPAHPRRDVAAERRAANRAVVVSAVGLAATGLIEIALALATGSVALLADALHNLSDVSSSAIVFVGFRLSKRPPTPAYPYGYERAEDLAGLAVALLIWASAALAGYESWHKLVGGRPTTLVGLGIAGAALGIVGNQLVARSKLAVGRRIHSATLVADAKHSWLDALSSAGALAGLVLVSRWGTAGATRWPGSPSPRSSSTSAGRSPATWPAG